ncbi:MAG: SigB/SigF/SigG family RNA polymerase sigma factor [Clostridiaceae bacterium]|nr:SigB/SigF/SigG family RNA polymerase sigma factor [Clostridiaceae bacterium]
MVYENKIEDILEAQKGNQDKMTKLIEENNGLIWSIVKRFKDRGYEIEDLYQIGSIGLIKSIKKFDSSFDVKLSTYAVPYILGEIKRFVRDDGSVKVSRSIKELAIKIRDLQSKFLKEKGREITILEIANELKTAKEEVALAMDSLKPTISIYEGSYEKENGEGSISFIDTLSTNIDETEQLVNKLSIKEVIHELKEREKEIIMLRYYKNKTQIEVAKILGISQVQVSRIEKKILNSMKVKLAM